MHCDFYSLVEVEPETRNPTVVDNLDVQCVQEVSEIPSLPENIFQHSIIQDGLVWNINGINIQVFLTSKGDSPHYTTSPKKISLRKGASNVKLYSNDLVGAELVTMNSNIYGLDNLKNEIKEYLDLMLNYPLLKRELKVESILSITGKISKTSLIKSVFYWFAHRHCCLIVDCRIWKDVKALQSFIKEKGTVLICFDNADLLSQNIVDIECISVVTAVDSIKSLESRIGKRVVIPSVYSKESIYSFIRGFGIKGNIEAVCSKCREYSFGFSDLQLLCQRAVQIGAADGSVEAVHLTRAFDWISSRRKSVAKGDWNRIGGLDETKRVLKETLEWPVKYSRIFAQCPLRLRSGILLYGYPGCGKTVLANSLVGLCGGLNFISVKGPEILNKYIGESEKGVRDLFERAAARKPCLLFFDEFDSIAPVCRFPYSRDEAEIGLELLTVLSINC